MIENIEKGWKVESVFRFGHTLLIIYKDGDVRGQVSMLDKDEEKIWMEMIRKLNELRK